MLKGFIWSYPVQIVRWIDGDTPYVILDVGFRMRYEGRARIIGIDAPEIKTPDGPAAKAYAEHLAPVGAVYVARSRELDPHARPLIELVLEDGSDFAKRMLDSGHAAVYVG